MYIFKPQCKEFLKPCSHCCFVTTVKRRLEKTKHNSSMSKSSLLGHMAILRNFQHGGGNGEGGQQIEHSSTTCWCLEYQQKKCQKCSPYYHFPQTFQVLSKYASALLNTVTKNPYWEVRGLPFLFLSSSHLQFMTLIKTKCVRIPQGLLNYNIWNIWCLPNTVNLKTGCFLLTTAFKIGKLQSSPKWKPLLRKTLSNMKPQPPYCQLELCFISSQANTFH